MESTESRMRLCVYEKELPAGTVSSYKPEVVSLPILTEWIQSKSYFLIVVDGKESAFDLLKQKMLDTHRHLYRMIILGTHFSTEEAIYFLNHSSVIKLIEQTSNTIRIDQDIETSLTVLRQLLESDDIISKVRFQNKTLNEINDNLEVIVGQRTENLQRSKIAVESTLRGVKDLIKFIKNLSQIDNFDDFIILLRQEFLKFHKIRSPLLVYSLGGAELRCIFFQGPQIIDQVLKTDESQLFTSDVSILREALANALERPIGPILSLQFIFSNNKGVLIFEHSLTDDEQVLFLNVLEERAESLRVAFERLVLKWRAHLISRQWSSTFDLLKDPILIIDKNFRVVRANNKFSQYSGDFCYQLFASRTEACVGCPTIKSILDQKPYSNKVNVVNKTYDVDAFPITVEGHSESTNWIVYYKDVTQSAHLQGQLVQSEKMAAIGMLAGNIAHELNNPLTGIKSLTQILLSEVPSSTPLFSDLSEVRNASERCEQIIKNLLDFSTGKTSELKKCSLRDVVEKTLPLLKTAMHYFSAHVVLAQTSDKVLVDPQLLQQVIFNLVNNSCQAMENSGSLYISSEVNSQNVLLRVRDTGPGVPMHIRSEIFAPFFTTKDEGQGTGLGLSVSRSIIEKFKGQLYLNESVVEGSEFVIELPRSED